MTLNELEEAVARLSLPELSLFSEWFDEYRADAWDRRIEEDVLAGRLDEALQRADEDFEGGRCSPL